MPLLRMKQYLQQPLDWADVMGIARSRMVVGSSAVSAHWTIARVTATTCSGAGTGRRALGFLCLPRRQLDAIDYELATGKVPWAHWQAQERGLPDPVPRTTTPLFDVIRRRMQEAYAMRAALSVRRRDA